MVVLNFVVRGSVLSARGKLPQVTTRSNKFFTLNVELDDVWSEYTVTVFFSNKAKPDAAEDVFPVLLHNGSCIVPHEVLDASDVTAYMWLMGLKDDVRATTNIITIPLTASGYLEGVAPEEPTPDVYTEILESVRGAYNIANDVRADADAGKFNGKPGVKGDPGVGVPPGGTTGQVLTKASGADYGTEWRTPSGGGTADAVLYTEQTLTAPQKLQARKNIDALGSVTPNIQNYMVITPPGQDAGTGVALSARGTGGNFTLDIADANEGQPTKLMGVKTPVDAEVHAAATVEFVLNKLAGATGGTVDAVMSDTSAHAVQNKVIKKYVDDSAAKKLNQTEPVIKDGVTIESGSFQIYAQPNGQTSATGEDFASLNFSDNSPQGTGSGIVISGLANFGDAEAVGLEDTAVSYAQLVAYTTPLTLTYDNNQVTGASYADIRKAITRGRQIKLAVANTTDIIASNAKNETDKCVLRFIHTDVGGDAVNITQYTVTAQASGLTVNVKSHEIADGSEVSY